MESSIMRFNRINKLLLFVTYISITLAQNDVTYISITPAQSDYSDAMIYYRDEIHYLRNYVIAPFYEEGNFRGLKTRLIEELKNQKHPGNRIYLTLYQAKTEYCLGNFQKAKGYEEKINSELTDNYTKYLYHFPSSYNISTCQDNLCFCSTADLKSERDNLDLLMDEELSKNFSSIYLFFQKRQLPIGSAESWDKSGVPFSSSLYLINHKSSIVRSNGEPVSAQLFIQTAIGKTKTLSDLEEDYERLELYHATNNRLRYLVKVSTPLDFTYEYEKRNFTTQGLQYIPRVKGYILIDDYRYYFKLSDDDVDNQKSLPIFWKDGWEIHPHIEKNLIRILVNKDYENAINIAIAGDEKRNILDLINSDNEVIFVDNAQKPLSEDKWSELAAGNYFQTREIELRIAELEEIDDTERIVLELTNNYESYSDEYKRKRKSILILGAGLILNLCLSLF